MILCLFVAFCELPCIVLIPINNLSKLGSSAAKTGKTKEDQKKQDYVMRSFLCVEHRILHWHITVVNFFHCYINKFSCFMKLRSL